MASFDFLGIYEVGHRWLRSQRISSFRPLDPESQLFIDQLESISDFENIYFARVLSCIRTANGLNRRLLIREHTHQYFFDDDFPALPNSYSWLNEELESQCTIVAPGIVSVRDPIDCWLGMKASFPKLVQYSFSEYCERYLYWLNNVEKKRAAGSPIFQFRYEDFVVNSNDLIRQISDFLGVVASDARTLANVTTSGNSGRQSDKLGQRRRRPYSSALVSEALNSAAYRTLCSSLQYDEIVDVPQSRRYLANGLSAIRRPFARVKRCMKELFRRGT